MTKELMALLDDNQKQLQEAEHAGRFSNELIEKIEGAGFFNLTRPRRYGGYEVEYEELLQLIILVAMRSGSLAWCLMIMAQHNVSSSAYQQKVTDELFQGEALKLATSFTPVGMAERSDHGYRVSGSWRYATGIHFANWMLVDAEIRGEGESLIGKFLVPADKFQIHDDWHVLGMKATGSCSVTLPATDVPEWHCVARAGPNHADDSRRQKLPRRYRIPQRIMTGLGTVVPMIGMLNGMVNDALPPSLGQGRSGNSLEEIAIRNHLLEVKAKVEQVDVLFRSLASKVTALTMMLGGGFDAKTQYGILLQCANLTDRCRELSSEIFSLCGTKASMGESNIGRRMVDIHVMSTHYLVRRSVVGINAALASLNG